MSLTADLLWTRIQQLDLRTAQELNDLKEKFAEESRGATDVDVLSKWLMDHGGLSPYQVDVVTGQSQEPLHVGPYEVHDRVEAGRLAGVYRARHKELDFPVCLKLVETGGDSGDPQGRQARFQREARISVQVDSPHVVRTFQIGQVDSTYFIAFEDLVGQSLHELIKADSALVSGTFDHIEKLWDMSRGQTNPREVCRLIREAALGLAHLHDQDIIHRDVIPRNLWVNEKNHVKVMDFGLARDALEYLDSPLTEALTAGFNEFLGSTDYMSPEQAIDPEKVTPASDIYSLGCTLYHALTGQLPYTAPTAAKQMIMHALGGAIPPSHINDEVYEQLDDVVFGMMAVQPGDRYQSALTVVEALEPFIDPSEHLIYEEARTPQLVDFLRWLDEDAAIFSGGSKRKNIAVSPTPAVSTTPDLTAAPARPDTLDEDDESPLDDPSRVEDTCDNLEKHLKDQAD